MARSCSRGDARGPRPVLATLGRLDSGNADHALAGGGAPPRNRFTRVWREAALAFCPARPQPDGAGARLPDRFGKRARSGPLRAGIRAARPLSEARARLAGLSQARALR